MRASTPKANPAASAQRRKPWPPWPNLPSLAMLVPAQEENQSAVRATKRPASRLNPAPSSGRYVLSCAPNGNLSVVFGGLCLLRTNGEPEGQPARLCPPRQLPHAVPRQEAWRCPWRPTASSHDRRVAVHLSDPRAIHCDHPGPVGPRRACGARSPPQLGCSRPCVDANTFSTRFSTSFSA
jgi:hypothetical protein